MAVSKVEFYWMAILLSLFFLQPGCTAKKNEAQKMFQYFSLQPGPGFSIVFDVEALTVTPEIENSPFGIPPSGFEICDTESSYICFEAEFGNMVFSFPKNLNARESWEFGNRKFFIVKETLSTECGSNYFVKAEKNGKPTQLFEFNNMNGLRSIYAIHSVEVIELEFVESETYKFGEILVADGIGFGADGNCSLNP